MAGWIIEPDDHSPSAGDRCIGRPARPRVCSARSPRCSSKTARSTPHRATGALPLLSTSDGWPANSRARRHGARHQHRLRDYGYLHPAHDGGQGHATLDRQRVTLNAADVVARQSTPPPPSSCPAALPDAPAAPHTTPTRRPAGHRRCRRRLAPMWPPVAPPARSLRGSAWPIRRGRRNDPRTSSRDSGGHERRGAEER